MSTTTALAQTLKKPSELLAKKTLRMDGFVPKAKRGGSGPAHCRRDGSFRVKSIANVLGMLSLFNMAW